MTLQDLTANANAGNVSQDEPKATSAPSETPPSEPATTSASPDAAPASIEEFIPTIVNLQSPQNWLSAPPTFVPQSFQDQIQFVFASGIYSLYFYANNQWNQIASGVSAASVYGDGSDGAGTFDGSTVVAGITPSGSIYTLTRDIFLTSVTVSGGVTVKWNGFRIFSQGAAASAGTMDISGGNGGAGGAGVDHSGNGTSNGGTAGAAGTGIPTGTIKQPGNGVAGSVGGNGQNQTANGKNGSAGSNEPNGILSNNAVGGGNSGTGAGNTGTGASSNASTGGTGGSIIQTTKAAALAILTFLVNALGAIGCNPTPGSGAGGGGGWSTNPSTSSDAGGGGGGGSGAPGGIGWLAAPSFVNTGTLKGTGGAGGNGGNGGNATGGSGFNDGGGGGGGGGGGNGGLIIIITPSYTNSGSVSVGGGAGGTGGIAGTGPGVNVSPANGSNGSTGANGLLIHISP